MRIEPITVSYLNKYIKVKDEGSLIKCIMFKSSTATLNFTPKDGMKVLVLGTVSVFERDRNLSNICKSDEGRWNWRLI